jgi:hypothetical protein
MRSLRLWPLWRPVQLIKRAEPMQRSSKRCFMDRATGERMRAQANDFGSEVIPGAKDMGMHIQAYLYQGYWEDIGTVEAFYESNLALTDNPAPKFRRAASPSTARAATTVSGAMPGPHTSHVLVLCCSCGSGPYTSRCCLLAQSAATWTQRPGSAARCAGARLRGEHMSAQPVRACSFPACSMVTRRSPPTSTPTHAHTQPLPPTLNLTPIRTPPPAARARRAAGVQAEVLAGEAVRRWGACG